MPYNTNKDLPDNVRSSLTESYQTKWREVFNSAYDGSCKGDDVCASKMAWSVVKGKKNSIHDSHDFSVVKFSSPMKVALNQTGEVLKVSGVLVHEGTFVGMDNVPTTFSVGALERIYNGIKDNPKLYITHENRDNVGYSYKFGFEQSTGTIIFEGLVFDKHAQDMILNKGYNMVSAEYDPYELDPSSTADHHILYNAHLPGIAFVKYPAVRDAYTISMPIRLQRGGKQLMTHEDMDKMKGVLKAKGMKDEDISDVCGQMTKMMEAGTTSTDPSPDVFAIQSTMSQMVKDMKAMQDGTAKLQTELEAARNDTKKFQSIITTMQEEKLNVAKQGLIAMGIPEPEKMVDGLPVEQQITLLGKMKERMAMSTPLMQGLQNMRNVDLTANKMIEGEVIKELGLTELASKFKVGA